MRKLKFALLFCLVGGIFSCAETTNREKEEEQKPMEEDTSPAVENTKKTYYPIPSPEQMFGFINDNGVKYNMNLINDTETISMYTEPSKKALNFGVYTADLAYSAAYQDIETTINLYKGVKRLASEMNIDDMMTEEMMAKVQVHMQNPDSLALIAADSYYQSVEYLEKNGQEGKLALISLGGWIESMYITTSSLKDFDQNSSTINRVADQKVTFGNLYNYLKMNSKRTGVAEEIEKIENIRKVFSGLVIKQKESEKNKKSGKLVFGKGKKITMTKEQFDTLKSAVSDYRKQITGKTS